MDITSDNFEAQLDAIRKSIADCDLIAFDTEFSGLGRGGSSLGFYDTPSVAYSKLRENVGNFLLMQFGLCTFKYDEASKSYTYDAYNAYVFPRLPPTLQAIRDTPTNRRTYDMQPESYMLLADHHFDFNAWVGKGVGYMHTDDAAEMRTKVVKSHEFYAAADKEKKEGGKERQEPRIPNHIKPRIAKAMSEITAYLAPDVDHAQPLVLLNYSGFERKLIYGMIEATMGDKHVYTERRKSDQAMMVFYCRDEAQHEEFRKAALQGKLDEIESARGFALVIDAIAASGKPVVGHNMILDVLYTVKSFVAELPFEWATLQRLMTTTLPCLYDTKVLANLHTVRTLVGANPSLGSLAVRVGQPPFVQFDFRASTAACGYESAPTTQPTASSMMTSTADPRMHSAGYDAYVTGKVFIAMCNHTANFKEPSRKSLGIHWASVEECRNKMALGKVSDMQSLDLVGSSDSIPDRTHIFHLAMTADAWKTADIIGLFSVYGNINVQWIDSTNAFLTLVNRNNAKQVTDSFCTGTTHGSGDLKFALTTERQHRMANEVQHCHRRDTASSSECKLKNGLGKMRVGDDEAQPKKRLKM